MKVSTKGGSPPKAVCTLCVSGRQTPSSYSEAEKHRLLAPAGPGIQYDMGPKQKIQAEANALAGPKAHRTAICYVSILNSKPTNTIKPIINYK